MSELAFAAILFLMWVFGFGTGYFVAWLKQ